MNTQHIRGIHYKSGQTIEIGVDEGVISSIKPLDQTSDPLPFIAPGLVDLQINGFGGIDFNNGPISGQELEKLLAQLYQEGVTRFFPTFITQDHQQLIDSIRALVRAVDDLQTGSISGIHLEGPFISPLDGPRGAHPVAFVCPPDKRMFEQLQDAAKGMVKLITLSPEWPDTSAFIEWCVNKGVIVSIGHTAATTAQIRDAIAAGASMSTHIGNGAHLMLPRHPNYLWEQMASDQLSAGMIADGFHLPDAFMRVCMKAKAGRLFLVSDSTALARMAPGIYQAPIGGEVVLREDGRLSLLSNPQVLAGSAVSLLDCINYLNRVGLCSWEEAWEMASVVPASLIGLHPNWGLNPGAPADLVLVELDKDAGLIVRKTFLEGEILFMREN